MWLERPKRNFQLYSSVDPESPEGQVQVKVQFVIRAWADIRRKLEKLDYWHEKGLNELLREAQKVYLRREEEKTKTKAKVMIAIARESAGDRKNEPRGDELRGDRPKGVGLKEEAKRRRELDREKKSPWADVTCYYCQGKGHTQQFCKKKQMDEAIAREQDLWNGSLEEIEGMMSRGVRGCTLCRMGGNIKQSLW